MVGTAVTDYVVAKLAKSDDAPGYNVTGTSDMNPIEEQIALLKQLCPEAKTVGVLYTSSEDNSVLQAGLAKEYIEAAGLEYVEVTVTGTNDVQQATQSIVKKCDAILHPHGQHLCFGDAHGLRRGDGIQDAGYLRRIGHGGSRRPGDAGHQLPRLGLPDRPNGD